jgi:hydroxyethylthiazole kinase-like uncharacterized protein yjeF
MDGYRLDQIRQAEQRAFAEVGPDALMQRAAAGLATAILRRLDRPYGSRVLLVVGSGNNGGDALYAGVRLAARGVQVSCWRTGSTVHAEGWAALLAAGGLEASGGEATALLAVADVVVDAVAGIGSRPGLAEPVAAFAKACEEAGVPVVAVDLPSGLAPEPPFVDAPHFTAELTVTFGGYKLCQLLEPARSACGEIELVDIGLELADPAVHQWQPEEVAAIWPVPDASSDKYSRGVVGLDTGSPDYPGAAVLGAAGAIYAGAGMVRHLGSAQVASRVLDVFANVVAAPGRVQALVIGSGWGDRKDVGVVTWAMGTGVPMVVDADGLRHLPGQGRETVLLTPHAGTGLSARHRSGRGECRPVGCSASGGRPNRLHRAAQRRHPIRRQPRTGEGGVGRAGTWMDGPSRIRGCTGRDRGRAACRWARTCAGRSCCRLRAGHGGRGKSRPTPTSGPRPLPACLDRRDHRPALSGLSAVIRCPAARGSKANRVLDVAGIESSGSPDCPSGC